MENHGEHNQLPASFTVWMSKLSIPSSKPYNDWSIYMKHLEILNKIRLQVIKKHGDVSVLGSV